MDEFSNKYFYGCLAVDWEDIRKRMWCGFVVTRWQVGGSGNARQGKHSSGKQALPVASKCGS